MEELSKEAFLQMAQFHGLDPGDEAHMEGLYVWVKDVLKATEPLEELDLKDVDPDLLFVPGQE